MDCIVDELIGRYEFASPNPAAEKISCWYKAIHLDWVKQRTQFMKSPCFQRVGNHGGKWPCGEPAFPDRPPGHHAGRDCWGFAGLITLHSGKKSALRELQKGLIVDTDFHFGDGTDNIYEDDYDVKYYHVYNVEGLEQFHSISRECDLIAVSAGFDKHKSD